MDGTAIAVAAIAGLGSGAVGSLIAPWSQNAVETRRARQSRRADLIVQWRFMIKLYLGGGPVNGPTDMAKYEAWLSLRPRLTNEVRNLVESVPSPIVITQGARGVAANEPLRRVSDEIDALERKWKLI